MTPRIIPSREHGCTGKANLGSNYEKQAEQFAAKYGKTYGVYRCPHCQGTHLTTHPSIAAKYFEALIYTTKTYGLHAEI